MQSYSERLIERFGLLWGKQKVLAQFGSTPGEIAAAKDAWEDQLRSTPPEVIKRVLEHLRTDPPDWPPSLAQWIKLCKEHNRPEHKTALPPPSKEITPEGQKLIQSAVAQIRTPAYDPLHWAKHPKSAQAVMLLWRGVKQDTRLRDIWDHHIATDGRDCTPEARGQLLAIKEIYRPVAVD